MTGRSALGPGGEGRTDVSQKILQDMLSSRKPIPPTCVARTVAHSWTFFTKPKRACQGYEEPHGGLCSDRKHLPSLPRQFPKVVSQPGPPASVRPACTFHWPISSRWRRRRCPQEVSVSGLGPHPSCSLLQPPRGPPSAAGPDRTCALDSPPPPPPPVELWASHRNAESCRACWRRSCCAGAWWGENVETQIPSLRQRGHYWPKELGFPFYPFQKPLFSWTHYPFLHLHQVGLAAPLITS